MRRATAVAVIAITLFATSVSARRILWRVGDVPPVPLPSALDLAKAELNDDSYFCIGATLVQTYTKGDWELRYSTKDGKQMWVSVGSDKSIRKSEDGFIH